MYASWDLRVATLDCSRVNVILHFGSRVLHGLHSREPWRSSGKMLLVGESPHVDVSLSPADFSHASLPRCAPGLALYGLFDQEGEVASNTSCTTGLVCIQQQHGECMCGMTSNIITVCTR
jgi:hypothetical protein